MLLKFEIVKFYDFYFYLFSKVKYPFYSMSTGQTERCEALKATDLDDFFGLGAHGQREEAHAETKLRSSRNQRHSHRAKKLAEVCIS